MPMNSTMVFGVAIVAIAALVLVPVLRRIIGAIIATAIVIGAIVAAIGALAILMNNVTIFDSPGTQARIIRFATINWAATSEKGLGSTTCETASSAGAVIAPAPPTAPSKPSEPAPKPAPTAHATPSPSPGLIATPPPEQEEDVYPELVRRGYPGISRAKLFQLAESTVNGLGGWKIVNSDPRTFTLDCIYTTRIFGFEDEVRIVATPRSEIDLCSRSRNGLPGNTSILSNFSGDFGANIGHIKEFYTALEPAIDQVYKEEEKKQNAEPSGPR